MYFFAAGDDWWWKLLIPVIAAVVYGISHVIKNADNAKQGAARTRPIPAPRQATPQSDIDRFLQEIQRQRDQERCSAGKSAPQTVAAKSTSQPKQRSLRQRSVPVQQRPRRRDDVVLVAELVPDEEIPMVLPAAPLAHSRAPSEPFVPIMTVQKQSPQQLLALGQMLSSPQGMRTAFVLSQILGTPKCRK